MKYALINAVLLAGYGLASPLPSRETRSINIPSEQPAADTDQAFTETVWAAGHAAGAEAGKQAADAAQAAQAAEAAQAAGAKRDTRSINVPSEQPAANTDQRFSTNVWAAGHAAGAEAGKQAADAAQAAEAAKAAGAKRDQGAQAEGPDSWFIPEIWNFKRDQPAAETDQAFTETVWAAGHAAGAEAGKQAADAAQAAQAAEAAQAAGAKRDQGAKAEAEADEDFHPRAWLKRDQASIETDAEFSPRLWLKRDQPAANTDQAFTEPVWAAGHAAGAEAGKQAADAAQAAQAAEAAGAKRDQGAQAEADTRFFVWM